MKTQLFTALFCSLMLGGCSDNSDSTGDASTLEHAKATAVEKLESGKEKVTYTIDSAKEKTEDAIAATKEKVGEAKEKAEDGINTAKDIIGDGTVTKGLIEDKKDALMYELGK